MNEWFSEWKNNEVGSVSVAEVGSGSVADPVILRIQDISDRPTDMFTQVQRTILR